MYKICNIAEIKETLNNPRLIKDNKFKLLVKSIKKSPWMLNLRPIVVDETMTILGGNMRLRACKAVGMFEVPVYIATGLTQAEKKEFIIKDNVGFGEWDWDIIANEWDLQELIEWGFDLPVYDLPLDDEDLKDKNNDKEVCELCGK